LYPLAMAVSLAYFAEHYIVDALIGWLYVGASFLVWNRIERAIETRRTPPDSGDSGNEPIQAAADSDIAAPAL